MAQVSIVKAAIMLAFAVAALSATFTTVSAQAPAPAPDAVAGNAFSLPVSGAVVGASLLVSAFALLRH
ncbi:hypothetical protein BUALT_Bualt16G0122700 [Buddleja alternifolia]|uniref:Uncharacterized protein n=1 Tax=Buddleja alternifolia TaxID=168488 RepID=A0AAV6WB52_9LAMI|nr:hypothetical protein BUALT_Bualt16G0122700 [Buddleja alternifolia]